jgi:preprotein translocase subunit SecB
MEKKSGFQFKGYKVLKSHIEVSGESGDDLTVSFAPKGLLDRSHKTFKLDLLISISENTGSLNIEVLISGDFVFNEETNLENFLYVNAPAIMFPYVRSYITALTALSGIPTITLPTMNLSGLQKEIENNTTEVNG